MSCLVHHPEERGKKILLVIAGCQAGILGAEMCAEWVRDGIYTSCLEIETETLGYFLI